MVENGGVQQCRRVHTTISLLPRLPPTRMWKAWRLVRSCWIVRSLRRWAGRTRPRVYLFSSVAAWCWWWWCWCGCGSSVLRDCYLVCVCVSECVCEWVCVCVISQLPGTLCALIVITRAWDDDTKWSDGWVALSVCLTVCWCLPFPFYAPMAITKQALLQTFAVGVGCLALGYFLAKRQSFRALHPPSNSLPFQDTDTHEVEELADKFEDFKMVLLTSFLGSIRV